MSAIPKGWIFNHAQKSEDDDGVWEVGFLDPEDGDFASVITIDTGLYYQDTHAEPIARAVLAMLQASAPEPAGWAVTYDGKRVSYVFRDEDEARKEAVEVGGSARVVPVFLGSQP